ncbi:NAD(P)-dependent alcohol dehydrogenase [Nocardiopsis ansamitocini]|nr:NAD(P)-dependent alcohol dehydrogenase [Nocardiopsis ansamitocini]
MRAALYDSYGPPDVLYEGTLPVPVAKPGEALVRVHAISVNGGESVLREGKLGSLFGRRFPKQTGIDFVGEVVEPAAQGPGPRAGAMVWGGMPRLRQESAAEFVAVSPRRMALSPAGLDPVQAASLPVGTTAITALRDKARLGKGERLLVRGGSGGVGSIAVQLGRAMGAHVTALAGAKNLDFVRGLGADEVFDYRTTSPGDLGAFDVILDTAGTELPAYHGLLAPGGRMVGITPDADRILASAAFILASAVFGSRRVRFFSGNPGTSLFDDLTAYVERGEIRPVVDTVYPLARIADAHRALEAGGVRGKYVVQVR